ncbi:MAG: carbohydrate binding domain-containing protein, partial [Armatimonadetes bacterium]|nr:carbohydrate binding domain-containing protein [Armatimonadota bacterium]
RALYYHWFEITRDPRLTNAGALPKEGLKSHFKPLLWLGDDDRGFCWFCESPKGWQVNDKESTLRVERQKGATVMRITMMDRPFTLDKEWKVVFGLMATPTRPMPKGWRDWLIPLNQSNPWSSWAPGFNNLSGTDDPGTLTPKDPEAMKKWVEQKHVSGDAVPFLPLKEPAKVIPYSQIVFWSGKLRDGMPSPEIKLFGPEWSNVNRPIGPRTEPDEQIPLKEYYWVCPGSSFSQFYLWKINQLIDQTGIDGIYIDGPWNTCSNEQHGCGYRDDKGVLQPEYKIWPFRELLKRVYCLFYEKRKDPIIHHHTSCWLSIPSISFSHIMLDGEQYHDAGQKVEDHFMDIVPLDKWRAEHTGRQWGPAPFILPDIPGQWCVPAAPTRELLMLTNLHDTGIFPAGNNWRLVMRNYQARRMFGVADCEFRGYWGNGNWVKCETPEVCVSIYRKPDASRCLLVVGNTAKSDAVAVVRPNLSGLKLKGGVATAAVDLETGEKIPIEKGVISLPVKARDFRLVALPFYKSPPITAGDLSASALREIPNSGFEKDMARWSAIPVDGNTGYAVADKETKSSGNASCHLHKVDGPGGVMIQTDDVFQVEPGKKYRVNCQVKIANSTGAQAYWMISALDSEGNSVLTNNLFAGFIKENQDWKPLPFEFPTPAGAAVIRLHFLVAFPGVADVWVDEVELKEAK